MPDPYFTTVTVTYRVVMCPVRGIIITRTRHVPTDVPRTALPTNLQRVAPEVMLMRIVPCELRGMERPAAPAMRAAVSVRNLLTVNAREPDVVELATERDTAGVAVVKLVVDVVVVLSTEAAVTAAVVGTTDVEDELVLLEEVDELDELLEVVVDATVSEDTVTAAERSTWSFTPS